MVFSDRRKAELSAVKYKTSQKAVLFGIHRSEQRSEPQFTKNCIQGGVLILTSPNQRAKDWSLFAAFQLKLVQMLGRLVLIDWVTFLCQSQTLDERSR